MSTATREQLLSVLKPRSDVVVVPGLGEVGVRGLKASEVIEMANEFGTRYGDLPLLIYGVTDGNGGSPYTKGDMPAIADMPFEVVAPMLAGIKRLSGFGEEAPKASGVSS
jgi:hypothetical protein